MTVATALVSKDSFRTSTGASGAFAPDFFAFMIYLTTKTITAKPTIVFRRMKLVELLNAEPKLASIAKYTAIKSSILTVISLKSIISLIILACDYLILSNMTLDLERFRVGLSVYTRLPSFVGIKVQDFP